MIVYSLSLAVLNLGWLAAVVHHRWELAVVAALLVAAAVFLAGLSPYWVLYPMTAGPVVGIWWRNRAANRLTPPPDGHETTFRSACACVDCRDPR